MFGSFEAETSLVSETIIENRACGFNQTASNKSMIFIGRVRGVERQDDDETLIRDVDVYRTEGGWRVRTRA
ncbi:protein of unknown function [Burkholderia multivorans]